MYKSIHRRKQKMKKQRMKSALNDMIDAKHSIKTMKLEEEVKRKNRLKKLPDRQFYGQR